MTTSGPSRLLQYLPAIYHEDPFLGLFLKAFETILLGDEGVGGNRRPFRLQGTVYTEGDEVTTLRGTGTRFAEELRVGDLISIPEIGTRVVLEIVSDGSIVIDIPATVAGPPGVAVNRVGGLEEVIGRIASYFDPDGTPTEFLNWLAGWVALSLRENWEEEQQRRLIQEIVSIYPIRGTRIGLERYLKIYVGPGVTIKDQLASSFQVGVNSRVGIDTVLGGLPPHFFIVNVAFDEPNPAKLKEKAVAVAAVIDIEKPAHTYYKLNFTGPTFQVGMRSTVGKDTLI